MNFRWFIVTLVFGCLSLSGLGVSSASAQASDDTPSLEDRREQARIDRLWSRSWREFAGYYVKHDERFICVPSYDKRLPSSTGKTTREYQQDSAKEQEYTDDRGKERTRTLTKPDDEARAAVELLPQVAVGQYGTIHSGLVQTIADDKSLILEEIWLLDAQAARDAKQKLKDNLRENFAEDIEDAFRDRGRELRRNRGDGILRRRGAENESIDWGFEDRLSAADRQRDRVFTRYQWNVIGYRTEKLSEDERWPTGKAAEKGLQLVIVEVDGSSVTAVPTATIGKDISELDFLDLLDQREMTKTQFVELLTQAKRAARNDYARVVLAKLEGLESDIALEDDQDADEDEGGNDVVELAD